MLTDVDLNDMRAAIAELLPATCHILSVTRTSDGQGGFTDTWGTATANVSCRLDYKRGDERVFGATNQPYNGFVLSLPYDKTITAANRVKIGTTQYNVTMVDNGKSWAAVRRAALEAI
jgi:head-tail adaptor